MIKAMFKGSLTIPNVITAGRIVILPLFFLLYYTGHGYWAFATLLISGLSDTLDGTIARWLHQVSDLGKLLDPIADKLTQMAVAVFMYLEFKGCESESMQVFAWVFWIFFVKEAVMIVGAALMLVLHIRPVAAEMLGKVGTVVFYGVMLVIIAFGPEIGVVPKSFPVFTAPEMMIMVLVVLCAILSVLAFFSYLPGVYHQAKERLQKEEK